MRRRTLLASLTAGGLSAVTGCAAFSNDSDQDKQPRQDYPLLATQRVFVSSAVSLTLPADVTRVDTPDDADIVILSGTTDTEAATGIGWLASDTGVALLGQESQSTLIEWLESDAYAEQFESEGIAVASPPPDFLVAFGINQQYISSHRYTWAGKTTPTDSDLRSALEEALENRPGSTTAE